MTDNITLREAAQQALEALNSFLSDDLRPYQAAKVSDALRAALAARKQEPEPAFWRYKGNPPIWNRHKNTWIDHYYFAADKAKALRYDNNPQPLYTAPPDDIEALRRDAERYRWHRADIAKHMGHSPEVIDAVTDAAMKEAALRQEKQE